MSFFLKINLFFNKDKEILFLPEVIFDVLESYTMACLGCSI